jgi:F0F1-type ATP synthase delta subunit
MNKLNEISEKLNKLDRIERRLSNLEEIISDSFDITQLSDFISVGF